jgi:hypothetical protein
VILESLIAMNGGGGVTTERKTRISQPADGSARCRGSRVPGQPSDSCPSTRPPTTPSTFSAISPPPARTGSSGPRPCRRGVRLLLWREPDRPDAFLRLSFVNVTSPRVPSVRGTADRDGSTRVS